MQVRRPELADAGKLLIFFEKLVKADPERVERMKDVKRLDVEKEREWIQQRLSGEKTQELFALVAEVDAEIVAEGEVERLKRWPERHVAEIRFGSLPGQEGVAFQIIEQLAHIAQKNGIEVLVFFHLSTQQREITIMQKAGFREVGRIKGYYKREGEYTDRVYMTKQLLNET